jgi:biopolymer transport protein ExbB/TolQ
MAMLVAVASIGAVGYASNGAQRAAATFSNVFTGSSSGENEAKRRRPPGDDQYGNPCAEDFNRAMKAEDETHEANLANVHNEAERRREERRHKVAVSQIRLRYEQCKHRRWWGGSQNNEHDD